jgi:hypothetical protein
MRHPPEVQFLIGDSPWLQPLLLLASILASSQLINFVFLGEMPLWRSAALGVSFLMSLGYAWTWMNRQIHGVLHWDGTDWHWSGFAECVCQLQLHLDLQSFMLVSVRSSGQAPAWLCLHRQQNPHHWIALRRAVVYACVPHRRERTNVA